MQGHPTFGRGVSPTARWPCRLTTGTADDPARFGSALGEFGERLAGGAFA
jgi:hypothetical protein